MKTVNVTALYDQIQKDFQQAITDSRLSMLAGLKQDIEKANLEKAVTVDNPARKVA